MQFQVPQYIDIEDKVIGPFTIKQFLYIIAAAGILFVLFKLVKFFIFIILAVPIAGLTCALAFIKIHNQPFINVIKSFFGFLRKPDFYVWKKPSPKEIVKEKQTPEIIKKTPPKKKAKPKSKTRLQEIGWKINVEK